MVDLLGGGGSIGINMNVNEVLANLASEALGGTRGSYEPVHPLRHVNASQSTADVCHTAARLAVAASAPATLRALDACVATLTARAEACAALRPWRALSPGCDADHRRRCSGVTPPRWRAGAARYDWRWRRSTPSSSAAP